MTDLTPKTFRAWAATQDPATTYDATDPYECALACWAKTLGATSTHYNAAIFPGGAFTPRFYPAPAMEAAVHQWTKDRATFGDLLARLDAQP